MKDLPALLALCLAALPSSAQTIPPGYEVGRWAGFRTAAVSYTFDDGTSGHLGTVVPLFDEHGFHATLFTVTGWSPNWVGLASAAAGGHEVASHTVSHPDLTTVGGTAQLAEMRESHDAIAANIPSSGSQTMAYPYCVKGNETATSLYYFAARGCQGFIESPTPADMLNISSIIVGTEGSVKTADHLNAKVGQAVGGGGWVVFLIHGVDSDGGWSPVPSAELGTHLGFMRERDATYWVETFGNVARYVRERDAARITELAVESDRITLSLTDNLPDGTYDYPVTLRRELPAGWPSATATQSGATLPAEMVDVDGSSRIMFDAVPDAGDIILAKGETVRTESSELPGQSSMLGAYPNPSSGRVTLDYRVGRDGPVTIDVFDLTGRRVRTLVNRFLPAGLYTQDWEMSGVRPGQYVIRLSSGTGADTGVLVVI